MKEVPRHFPDDDAPSTLYSEEDFEQIAAAIDIDATQIARHQNQFEWAANWNSADKRRPTRIAPSKMAAKLDSIAKNSSRLLKSLGVDDPTAAEDGPGDREILAALASSGDRSEDSVIEATRRIGRLAEICDAIKAAGELQRGAEQAAAEVAEVGKLTVREGHSGDDAINDWIAAMIGIYREITGREPATSVGGPERENEGVAGGPFIRFLMAAGKPLKFELAQDAWRSRVRTILDGASLPD